MIQPLTRLLWQRFIQKLFPPKPLAVPNQGWTLIEMLVVTIITGIFAALAAPSMMGMMGKADVSNAINQVKSGLQESQRIAMSKGTSCTVNLGSSASPPTLTSSSATVGCLSEVRTLPKSVIMLENFTNDTVSFSYKGNTTSSGTVVVVASNRQGEARCLVISNGLGIMRTGTYSGSVASGATISAGSCTTVL